jgi:alkylated DNA repair protein (DNA oxidative demethylase)
MDRRPYRHLHHGCSDALTPDLFPETHAGLVHLPGFACPQEAALIEAVHDITAAAPFRQMETPGGKMMSVAMTNCGAAGWVTDRRGYRYAATDPQTGKAWPAMPPLFRGLAVKAAEAAGFEDFEPDVCLVNCYVPRAKMTLHQDRDETDFSAPIVSVSLGLPAVFLWGGAARGDKASHVPLMSGDVLVWGGPARLNFHGVLPLRAGSHPLLGSSRVNLTFRKAL